jgi:hypothetical protein
LRLCLFKKIGYYFRSILGKLDHCFSLSSSLLFIWLADLKLP